MVNAEAAGRIEAVGSKIKMAQYHLDRLKDHAYASDRDDIQILWAAEFEGCMHCLHHCFDILGQAINSQLHVTTRKKFYLTDVIVALPEIPLKRECETLYVESDWLIAFVNYSKHHNVVQLFQRPFFLSPWQPASAVGVASFSYKGQDYPQIFDAVSYASSTFEKVLGQVNTIVALLSGT